MNVYTATYLARCGEILRIKPGIVLGTSEEDAQSQGMGGALVALPIDEGWTDHQVILALIPSQMTIGGYLLEWQITQ